VIRQDYAGIARNLVRHIHGGTADEIRLGFDSKLSFEDIFVSAVVFSNDPLHAN